MLRLRPADFVGQQVVQWGVNVNGVAVEHFSVNAWGDHEAIFQHTDPASEVTIVASGMVETSDLAGVVSGLKRDVPPAVFLRHTPLTMPDDAIIKLGQDATGDTVLGRLHSMSAIIRETVSYRGGVTTSRSTASEALAMGQGVCQDHAHIFASAARSIGIPARYVVGYLLASDDMQALHETHGWAEAYVDGLGWVGFDATNGVCTTPYYIRLCCGLDAREAAPIKGSVFGAKQIGIDADVVISEADGELTQQMQQQQ
jgi:transglutaminase-like putative cysteine protease